MQKILLIWLLLVLCCSLPGYAQTDKRPLYKPASSAPEPMDITRNSYGASRSAPNALRIGHTAPDFTLPRANGGKVSLALARKQGFVAIIFYRGHW